LKKLNLNKFAQIFQDLSKKHLGTYNKTSFATTTIFEKENPSLSRLLSIEIVATFLKNKKLGNQKDQKL
jgi:hypothetical protein